MYPKIFDGNAGANKYHWGTSDLRDSFATPQLGTKTANQDEYDNFLELRRAGRKIQVDTHKVSSPIRTDDLLQKFQRTGR
jgi:hypothetical protein